MTTMCNVRDLEGAVVCVRSVDREPCRDCPNLPDVAAEQAIQAASAPASPPNSTRRVLEDVAAERARQKARWRDLARPDGTHASASVPFLAAASGYSQATAQPARIDADGRNGATGNPVHPRARNAPQRPTGADSRAMLARALADATRMRPVVCDLCGVTIGLDTTRYADARHDCPAGRWYLITDPGRPTDA